MTDRDGTLFDVATDEEWHNAIRGQHRNGPRPLEHQDIAAAVLYLYTLGVGTRVKVKCSEDHANHKRDAARDHAYRRGISVTTRYNREIGCVLIECVK